MKHYTNFEAEQKKNNRSNGPLNVLGKLIGAIILFPVFVVRIFVKVYHKLK